jgi:eukaryotic-like serine/threonine-protein kinase
VKKSETLDESRRATGSGVDLAGGSVAALPLLDEGRFEVEGERARGGIGRVFEVTDRLLGRRLALKQPQASDPADGARFLREALITARLQHPAIVPIHDVAVRASGEPCYTMRLVPGATLRDVIAAARGLDERLALLPHVHAAANAVAYAHEQGILHRDLKPANVLVGPFGETVVIDWGLAKDLHGGIAEAEMAPLALDTGGGGGDLTRTGAVLGTPGYMAPEQARGEEVDERADVYSIGAILYHLLTGQTPHRAGATGGQVGGALAAALALPPRPVQELEPGAPPDLVAIVGKAMAGDRNARYASARETARDLGRFLAGQLVSARRYRLHARVGRQLRRHRTAVIVALVLLAVLAASGVASVQRIMAERNAAVQARRAVEARENALMLLQAERSLADDPTAALAWLKRFRPGPDGEWLKRAVAEEAIARGAARHVFPFDVTSQAFATSRVRPLAAVGGTDGAVWLLDLESGARRLLGRHDHPIAHVALSPVAGAGGAIPVAVSRDGVGRVRMWSEEGRLLHDLDLGRPSRVSGLSLSADGASLAVGLDQGQVMVMAMKDPARRWLHTAPGRLAGLRFCGAPRSWLVAIDFDGRAQVVMPLGGGGGARPRALEGRHPDARLACLFDGRRFVTGGTDGVAKLWDRERGVVRVLGRHRDWIAALAGSPDGRWVATGSGDDTIGLHDLEGGGTRTLGGHEDTVWGVVFSGDGRRLASVSRESVRLWDTASGELLRSYAVRGSETSGIDLGHDGRTVVAFSWKQARVLPLQTPEQQVLRGHTDFVTTLGWAGDSSAVVSGARDGTVQVWDRRGGGGGAATSLAFDSWPLDVQLLGGPGRRLLTTTRSARTTLVDLDRGTRVELARATPEASGQFPAAAYAPDGSRIVFVHDETTIKVHDLATGKQVALDGELPQISAFRFSGDGAVVAVSTHEGDAGLWDARTGRRLAHRRFPLRIDALALAPDRRSMALVTSGNRLLHWDLAGDRIVDLDEDGRVGWLLFYTPDSMTVGYLADGNTIRLRDLAGRAPTRVMRGHRARIIDMAVSPSAAAPLLATGDVEGFVRLWNWKTGATAALHTGAGTPHALTFSPDARALATSGRDAHLRVWDLATVDWVPAGTGPALAAHTSAVIQGAQEVRTP